MIRASLAIALSLAPVHAAFGTDAEHLRGLRTFFLAVEPPSEDAIKCGFTRAWLIARVGPVVAKAGLSLVGPEKLADGHIEVVVTALPDCSASASIEVSTMVLILKNGKRVMATAWRAAGIGGREGTARNFDGLTRALVTDWRSVNP